MLRLFALSYFFFSLLVCSTSFAADDVLKEQKIKQAVISNNQNYLYQELITIQKQFTALEVKLAQQNDSEKVKELKADLKKLNEDLIKLQEIVSKNEQVKSSEIKGVEGRISDLTVSTDRWGYIFSLFSLVITLAAIFMGWSTVRKSETEAKKAAKIAAAEWFSKNKDILLSPVTAEVSSVREKFEQYVAEYGNDLKKLKIEHEKDINNLIDKALNDKISQEEKQKIIDSTTEKSESKLTLKDRFSLGMSKFVNQEFEHAIEAFNYIVQQPLTDRDALIISKAWYSLGITYGQQELFDDSISAYNRLIELFNTFEDHDIQLQVAKAMRVLGLTYGKQGLFSKAISTFEQLVNKFNKHTYEKIIVEVVRATRILGITYENEGPQDKVIATLKQLIDKYHSHENIEIKVEIAQAMNNLGSTYRKKNLLSEAIKTYSLLLEQFKNNNNENIQIEVAQAMINLGISFEKNNNLDGEIDVLDKLVSQFINSEVEEINLLVVRGMSNLSFAYARKNLMDETIDIYQTLINNFIDHNNETIQIAVATAMVNLTVAYGQVGLIEKASNCHDELIDKFKSYKNKRVTELLITSSANLAELSILFEEPKDVISRIEKVDLNNPDEQTSIVMKFMRFLLDNVTFKEVVNSIELLSNDINLTWRFSEIKDYINKNFTGLKRQQIDAVVRFFEKHKDKEKFLEEAKALQQ